MPILNIAGYKFTILSGLSDLQQSLLAFACQQDLKGTILISKEGININLAGTVPSIEAFKTYLNSQPDLTGMTFHESYSETQPFKHLKIKVKKEIITMRQPEVNATETRAPSISPEELKKWLDENRDITLLDTRNDFEISYGAFNGAVNLHLNQFGELPSAIEALDPNKPVVMYCTGGIRCEKAALYMRQHGFPEVYQLDGGILGYFARVGSDHYSGGCFVFDERVSLKLDHFCAAR